MHDIKLACAALFTEADESPGLAGSRCRRCGEVYFPARTGCTRCCATDAEPFALGRRGILWSWTVQGFLPKAPYNSGETEQSFKPYGVGYVEMACGIKVESRLTVADPELLQIGMPMELTLEPYRTSPDGDPVHTYAFEPVKEKA